MHAERTIGNAIPDQRVEEPKILGKSSEEPKIWYGKVREKANLLIYREKIIKMEISVKLAKQEEAERKV